MMYFDVFDASVTNSISDDVLFAIVIGDNSNHIHG